MMCNYILFRSPFFCGQWSLLLLHRSLTYFGSFFNEIIMKIIFFFFKENFMKILDVGTWYELICQKGKIYRYL